MLVSKNPGGVGEYPIFGYVVLHPDTGLPVIDMVSTPKVSNLERSKCYAIVYGGVNWHFFVASHRSNKIEDMSLRADNRIPLWSKRMDTIAEIKEKAIAYIDKQKQNSRF